MATIQKTSKQATGTSFFGDEIKATTEQMEAILGKAGRFEDSKVSREWVRALIADKTIVYKGYFDDEIVFTIYDYKMPEFGDDEVIAWHIGGYNSESTGKVKQELERLLKLL